MSRTFQPFEPVYSREDLRDISRETDFAASRKSALNMARYRKDFARDLVGKTFPCRFDDGRFLCLQFPEVNKLIWTENNVDFYEEYCEPLKSTAGNVIGIHFLRRHEMPYEGAFFVLDMDTGFVTWVTIEIGTNLDEKFAVPFPHFGEVEGFGSHEGRRHHFSNDLVGKEIDWEYNEEFTIRHSYVSPTLTISPHLPHAHEEESEENEGFVGRLFLKAFNATIRDNLVLTSFTEPGNCAAVLLIDLNMVHDIGCFYGYTYQGRLCSETITAHGGLGRPGLKAKEGYKRPDAAE